MHRLPAAQRGTLEWAVRKEHGRLACNTFAFCFSMKERIYDDITSILTAFSLGLHFWEGSEEEGEGGLELRLLVLLIMSWGLM